MKDTCQRALELAAMDWERFSPNPMVGLWILMMINHWEKDIHQKYGEEHTQEVNAINAR